MMFVLMAWLFLWTVKCSPLLTVTGVTSLILNPRPLFGTITLAFLGSPMALAMLAAWKQNRGWQPVKNGARCLFLLPARTQVLVLNPARGPIDPGPYRIRLCLILLWLTLCSSMFMPLFVLFWLSSPWNTLMFA